MIGVSVGAQIGFAAFVQVGRQSTFRSCPGPIAAPFRAAPKGPLFKSRKAGGDTVVAREERLHREETLRKLLEQGPTMSRERLETPRSGVQRSDNEADARNVASKDRLDRSDEVTAAAVKRSGTYVT